MDRQVPAVATGVFEAGEADAMQVYALDDRVRVTVPDATDPDYRYDGVVGRVVAVRRSPLSPHTGDQRDDYLYRVAFENDRDTEMLFRHDDLSQQLP